MQLHCKPIALRYHYLFAYILVLMAFLDMFQVKITVYSR